LNSGDRRFGFLSVTPRWIVAQSVMTFFSVRFRSASVRQLRLEEILSLLNLSDFSLRYAFSAGFPPDQSAIFPSGPLNPLIVCAGNKITTLELPEDFYDPRFPRAAFLFLTRATPPSLKKGPISRPWQPGRRIPFLLAPNKKDPLPYFFTYSAGEIQLHISLKLQGAGIRFIPPSWGLPPPKTHFSGGTPDFTFGVPLDGFSSPTLDEIFLY